MQPKKVFAVINYDICNPNACDPKEGHCPAVAACSHKVIQQIDGPFESPMVFQDMCMGCWDCMAACPLEAIAMKQVG